MISLRLSGLALVATALCLSSAPVRASAQATPFGPARPSGAPTASPAPPLSTPSKPLEPPVNFVLQLGYDIGFQELLSVTLSDGDTRSIKANQGINASVGAAFLKLAEGRFATQASIGIEYSSIEASNGSARWLAFPLEVMEVAYVDPLRFGAGLSWLLKPTLKGEDFLAALDERYKNSLGFVLQADYVWRAPSSPRASRGTFGVRYVWQKLENARGGPAFGANALGFVLGFTG